MARQKKLKNICKRKDGRYIGKIQINGKRHQVYGATSEEVEAKFKDLHKRIEQGLDIIAKDHSLKDWCDMWLNDYIKFQIRTNTWTKYKLYLNRINEIIGHITIRKVTMIDIQKAANKLIQSGLNPVTVQGYRNVLHSALEYAVASNIILKNPVKGVRVKNAKYKEVTPLTAEQLKIFVAEAKKRNHHLEVLLLASTGIRKSELCGLKWLDVKWQDSQLLIQRTVVKIGAYDFIVADTKTKSSRRSIPLLPDVLSALRAKYDAIEGKNKDGQYIFQREDGRPIHPEKIYLYIKRIGKSIDLPDITVHTLRHTLATLLLTMGVSARVVQEILGHASIEQTLGTYAHVLPGTKEKALEPISQVLSF